jgi:hypothetical protein
MRNAKKIIPLSFLVLVLLALLVLPVSADLTLHFIDRSAFGSNPVTITDSSGSQVYNGTSTGIAVIPYENVTASYWVSFEPGGTADMLKDPQLGAENILHVVQGGAVGIILIIVVVWAIRRRH